MLFALIPVVCIEKRYNKFDLKSEFGDFFLLCCSAKPLLGHHALVWLLGFRMAGFMLSGSGIRVFVLGNMGLGWGGWGKVQINDGEGGGVVGMGCGRGQGWWCILLIGGA